MKDSGCGFLLPLQPFAYKPTFTTLYFTRWYSMAQSHHNNQRHSTTSTHELLDHEPEHGHHFKLQTTHTERVTSPTPPDGDRKGWIQCAASFCLWFVAWGMVNSFGK